MNPEVWEKISDAFAQVVEMPPERRDTYLSTLDMDPPAVEELRALLDASGVTQRWLRHTQLPLKTLLASEFKVCSFEAGDSFGDFEILQKLGQGGFGAVYKAFQKSLERVVALKFTPIIGRESEMMAGLEHDHIVSIYSVEREVLPGMQIICMQYIDGVSLDRVLTQLQGIELSSVSGATITRILDDYLKGQALFDSRGIEMRAHIEELSAAEALLYIMSKVALALDFTHKKDILHLDIKPQNILLNRYGKPLITDFNISLSAQAIKAAEDLPATFGGTLAYMSPEHKRVFEAEDKISTIDSRSDIYSMGVILGDIFTGQKQDFLKTLAEEVSRDCLEEDKSARVPSGESLANRLVNALELYRMSKQLANHLPLSVSKKWSKTFVVLIAIIPQILGSIVNISYNTMILASDLTINQSQVFHFLIPLYNLIVYPVCAYFLWKTFSPLFSFVSATREKLQAKNLKKLRHELIRMPVRYGWICSLGWLPGALVFPATLDLMSGPVQVEIYGHFIVSFLLSWLVALTYGFVFIDYYTIRFVYMKMWSTASELRDSQAELEMFRKRMANCQRIAALVPMLAAISMLYSAKPTDDFVWFKLQTFISLFILMGMAGFVVSQKTAQTLQQTVSAFGANTRHFEA